MAPIYDYSCQKCNHEFEADQKITEDPLTECPNCGSDQAKRFISSSSTFILKGGGWYSDGYASSNKKD